MKLSTDHHKVFLRKMLPGRKYRKRILIGEVRRYARQTKENRYWRAFPVGGAVEFPEIFDNHVLALKFLKDRWEAGSVSPEAQPVKSKSHPRPQKVRLPKAGQTPETAASWVAFFGEDPFETASGGEE